MLVILGQSTSLVGQDERLSALLSSIKEVQERFDIPAVGLGIVRDGKIIYQGAWSTEGALPDGANTYFRMGSITKTFISLGLLELEKRGKLQLDMPVSALAPEIGLENPWKETDPVTLRHLLEHTSGLYDMSFHEIFAPGGDYLSTQEALRLTTSAHTVRWKPGSYFSYSNPGYLIAGYILEKYAGMPFEKYLSSEVLPRYNMQNSFFDERIIEEDKRPIGYVHKGRWVLSPNRTLINRWSGSMVSTPADMTEFMLRLLADSTHLDLSLREMARPATARAAQSGIEIGYALGMETLTMGGQLYIGNRGGGYNLSTRFRMLEETKSGFFLAFNTASGPFVRQIEQLLLRFIANRQKPKRLSSQPVPEELASGISGYYQLRSHRQKFLKPFERLTMGFDLSVRNDTLFRRSRMGRFTPLLMNSNSTFYSPGAATPHVLIEQNDNDWTLTETNLNGQYFVKESKVWAQLRFFGVLGAIVIVLLSVPLFLVMLVRQLIQSDKKVTRSTLFSLALGVLPLLMLLITTQLDLAEFDKLGSPNLLTLLFFTASLVYPVLLLTHLFFQRNELRFKNSWGRFFTLLHLGAHMAFFLFMILNGYIGMRLWAL